MADLSRELLDRPPEETARLLALSFLDEATEAAERLKKARDTEALHDFRVALRRFRSCLRSYRPHLKGSRPKKMRRRIKELASSTNVARDTQVQLAWLEPQVGKLTEQQKIGARWLIENLSTRQGAEQAPRLEDVIEGFFRLRQDLVEKLAVGAFRLDPEQPGKRSTFVSVTGGLICRQLSVLERDLARVESVADDKKIHQARIKGKRLRYLLEPLRREIPSAKDLVKHMKALQDVLGELHDTKVLEDEIASALETSAVQRARRLQESLGGLLSSEDSWEERHGLLELLRMLRARAQALFDEAQAQFLGDRGRPIFASIEELGRRISSRNGVTETERRFLLRRLPDPAKGSPGRLIDQGWLASPGTSELLKRERSGGRLTYYRQIRGVEEPISKKYFAALWPLTEKRRLRKRCYEITEQGAKWRVSELADRGLVLADLNPSPGESEIELPDWLTACLVEEVTGKAKYEDARLAASRPTPRQKRDPRRSKRKTAHG